MKKLLSAVVISIVSGQVSSQVPVEERGSPRVANQQAPAVSTLPESQPVTQVVVPADSPQPVAQLDTFDTLQILQQEVMTLRGMVEQLNYEIQQLKQRQVDDYLDLDRRISGASVSPASQTGSAEVTAEAATTTTLAANTTTEKTGADKAEVEEYSAAYNLLKKGDLTSAKTALLRHIERFPRGDYTANAHYWLGEVYLLENELQQAINSFAKVVNDYPVHRKSADARFKLGKSYHLAGDNQQALRYLKQSAEGAGSSAQLAKKYLSENF